MANKKTLKLFAPAILFLLSFILTNCGVWTDFKTYFNTYYNAKTLFDATEEAIIKQQKDPFLFRNEEKPTSQFNTPVQSNTRRTNQNVPAGNTGNQRTQNSPQSQIFQDLNKVIEKCSKVLQFEKESSFFDDALFITGKSFYYQEEYARAQRKFLELSALPKSDYAPENKLWLAKTYLQLRSFEDGLKLIEEVKTEALKDDNEELYAQACITKIGFFVYREEYTNAIAECQRFLKNLKNDEMASLVWYKMGNIYLEQGEEESALEAFSSVLNYSPTFEIEFESRIQHSLLLKDLGKLDESENELNSLLEGGKFKSQLDRIMLELGDIYYERKDFDRAIKTFIEVDSTFKNTQSAGNAGFMLGKIYEKQFGNYDSAYKYYKKTILSTASYDTKTNASDYVKNIDRYFIFKKSISDYNKSYIYLNNPTKYMQDSIDYDLAYKDYMVDVNIKVDSMVASAQATQISSSNQRNVFEQQVKALMQQNALKAIVNNKATTVITLKDLIIQGKVDKPQIPKIKEDSVKTLLSQELYNLGSLFYSELERSDSAYFYFNEILNNFHEKPVAVPTYFALGTYYETQNQKQKADSLFQIIYDKYPKSPLFNEAAVKLGKLNKEEKKNITKEVDPAEQDYSVAEKNYYDMKYHEAINGLTKVYLNYPKSPYMLKAIYFIGLIYEENLKDYDSAAVFYNILTSKENSQTQYGKAVLAKISEYKKAKDFEEAEKKRKIEEEKKIELQKNLPIGNASSDSTGVQHEIDDTKINRNKIDDKSAPNDSTNSKENIRKGLFKDKEEHETVDSSKIIQKLE